MEEDHRTEGRMNTTSAIYIVARKSIAHALQRLPYIRKMPAFVIFIFLFHSWEERMRLLLQNAICKFAGS